MNIVLFDDARRDHLLPLTYTRPIADLRIGILTIKEKWDLISGTVCSYKTQDYLQEKFPINLSEDNILVAGSIIPDHHFFSVVSKLQIGEAIFHGNELIAARKGDASLDKENMKFRKINFDGSLKRVMNLWDIFGLNGIALESDFDNLTKGRRSAEPDQSNRVIGKRLFIEEGAKVSCAVLNSSEGSIYVGNQAEIWEGSLIRGGFALCEGSSVKMGAKIYGPTTVGPYSRVGGEISNCVIQGYSNKGHDGFLGNSVLGEWCNIGADSNNSNLKNNYATVKLWDYALKAQADTGLQFCGLIMGDHSKCGINTMFNTGTVVGVSANIFGAGFPPTNIPSFSWGGFDQSAEYNIEKALETMERVFSRRNKPFTEIDKLLIKNVFKITRK